MKRILSFSLILLAVTACIPSNAGVEYSATAGPLIQPPEDTVVPEYGQRARSHIVALTAIGPRPAGTDAEQQAAEYISGVLEAAGYSPETLWFSATDGFGSQIDSANVAAVKPGRSAQEIIVGAHYDSGNEGPGADDNASGVAVLLEVAELLKNESTPYTIRFVAFGAEEAGLLGSGAYLNQMSMGELENTIAMINLDSLIAGDICYAYSDESQSALRDWALSWAFGNGFDLQTVRNADLTDPDTGGGSSDYFPFQQVGIPFLYFEATNWNLGDQDGYTQVDPRFGEAGRIWHTPYDTLAYLDSTFPGRVDARLNLFVSLLYHLLIEYE